METDVPDDDLEEEDYYVSYSELMYDDISSCIKQFLIDYYGEQMNNLKSETYRKVEMVIQEEINLFGDTIPDILYRNRTITDSDLWDEALDNFERTDRTFPWPKNTQWYNRKYTKDSIGFLEDIPESELTEEQIGLKQIFESAENAINFHIEFSTFMKQGCTELISAMQSFIENKAPFDLSILSPEGFKLLQEHLESFADSLFDRLYIPILEE